MSFDRLKSWLTGGGAAGEGELDPSDLKSLLDEGTTLTLLDVREAGEVAVGALPGSVHIPLGQLASRAGELPQDVPVITICRSGMRSAQAAAWLGRNGFSAVRNLRGGLMAWARQVDSGFRVG